MPWRRLVEGATHPAVLAEIAERFGGAWTAHARTLEGIRTTQRRLADLGGVDWSMPFGTQAFPDDVRLATRLGERDRRISFADPVPSPFAPDDPLDHLTVPHWQIRDVPPDAEPQVTGHAPLRFRLGPVEFVYDRFGLHQTDDGRQHL